MTGIGKLHVACSQIQNAHPSGNKHTRFVIFAKLFICFCENIVNRHTAFCQVLDDSFSGHHKHSSWNSFARYVCSKESHGCIIQLIEIVEVATDFFCGNHFGINAILLIFGEVGGQGGKLNLLCIFQFLIDAGRCLSDISFQRGDGGIDIIGQGCELSIRANVNNCIQIALCNLCKGVVDFL